jgi:MerR family transcriptional regulator/heat shock protein HspR
MANDGDGNSGFGPSAAGRRDERALYVISVAAELAGVHPQTLRIYERKGLIEPARTSGRSRRYSDRDIALLRRIQELTNEGVSLVGVQKVLDLEARLADALDRIDRLEEQLEQARTDKKEAVDATHRLYRRELVPLRSASVVLFTREQS